MKLILKDIRKSFERKEVLKKINFEFEEGKIYGLLGRNGAGKTTLFNCINEDMELSDGTFYLQENNQKIKIKPEDIGYVMSIPVVPKFLTGREFLKFFIDINNEKVADLKTEDEYFDMINIEKEDRDKLINDYSLGMQNKMQMIVNIMFNSKVLLLDEPLTSLDVVASEEIKDILKRIKKDNYSFTNLTVAPLALMA